jgi:hypothetical protein
MKPLQTLDLVMLWVVRTFALALLAYVALIVRGDYMDEDGPFPINELLPYIIGCTAWGTTLLACTWYQSSIFSRAIFGLSAAFLAYVSIEIIAINSPFHTAIAQGNLTIWDFEVPALLVLGTLSTAWLAVRPIEMRPSRFVHSVHFV